MLVSWCGIGEEEEDSRQEIESSVKERMSVRERLESIGVFALGALALVVLAPLIILAIAIAVLFREPRIAVGMALALLLVTAITLAVGGKGVAEELAVYAYLFLAAGAILLLKRRILTTQGRKTIDEN